MEINEKIEKYLITEGNDEKIAKRMLKKKFGFNLEDVKREIEITLGFKEDDLGNHTFIERARDELAKLYKVHRSDVIVDDDLIMIKVEE